MFAQIRELHLYRDFLRQYTLQQIRSRYQDSVLGFLWTWLNPILTCVTFLFVFSFVSQVDLRSFGLFFLSGYIPWMFMTAAVGIGGNSIVGNTGYVTRIYVPNLIFPLSTTLVQLIDLMIGMLVIAMVFVALGAAWTPSLLVLPVSLVLVVAFTLGFVLIMSTATVFMRDILLLWASVSFVWFFLTPILYPLSKMPKEAQGWMELNPFLPFVRLFQEPIAFGRVPSMDVFAAAGLIAGIVLIAGFVTFSRAQKHFYLYL
jgi:ABC-type polysaccharide/polyol phosphate export permease